MHNEQTVCGMDGSGTHLADFKAETHYRPTASEWSGDVVS